MMIREKETIEEALKRGKRMLVYPVLVFHMVMILVYFWIFMYQAMFWPLALLAIFVLLFLFSWGYRSYFITKWKIRSYENTRNLDELKTSAILIGLISEQDGFLEKILRTAKEKQKLEELERRAETTQTFTDQAEVPPETRLSTPKRVYALRTVFFCAGLAAGIAAFWITKNRLHLLLSSVAFYYALKNMQKWRKHAPDIILSEKGIETKTCGLVGWEFISEEKILREDEDGVSFYLTFQYPGGEEKQRIDSFPVSAVRLHQLLRIYRGRFDKKSL